MNDFNDPHWKVKVDGKDAEILTCNYLMRGVKLDAGKHTVEFVFYDRKQSALFGVIVLIWLLLGGWGLLIRVRKRK